MQSGVRFKEYLFLHGKIYSIFSDLQDGHGFILSHKECQELLGNLKDDSLSVKEVEKALNGWPQIAD